MAALPSYFDRFLQEIRPTKNQREDMRSGHRTLRERLAAWEPLKATIVSDFLQGSYRRATAVRPVRDQRSDVDIVIVTNLDSAKTNPHEALELFRSFVKEYYPGKYKFQGRSIGIELSYVELDLVVTAAPSEVDKKALRFEAVRSWDTPEDVDDWRLNAFWVSVENREYLAAQSRLFKAAVEQEWKTEPLLIPDRDAQKWGKTHPLVQIAWTFDKNRITDRHYVNVVKAIKWWRRERHPEPEHPKSYPLEHMIGDCCPDGIASVAEGIVGTLEGIRDRFSDDAQAGRVPFLPDRGVPENNVLKRVEAVDFVRFHQQVVAAAGLAREAFDADTVESARLWRELLGSRFPEPPRGDGCAAGGSGSGVVGGFTERTEYSVPPRGRLG